jgi:hypothetical protein
VSYLLSPGRPPRRAAEAHPRSGDVVAAEIEPVTKHRYGLTVAFVRVGDTLVNSDWTRQGLGVYPALRPADLPGMEEVEGGGQGGKTGRAEWLTQPMLINHHV